VIFVDTNLFMYAVGRPHSLQPQARLFFDESLTSKTRLVTSSEVLQELLHVYLPVQRFATLDAAFALVDSCISSIWSVDGEDVRFARALADRYSDLNARDLLHLACCKRRGVHTLKTFDRTLASTAPFLAASTRP
jgi:predicted nucleic acid-binding protein